jgi:hypothetical protein
MNETSEPNHLVDLAERLIAQIRDHVLVVGTAQDPAEVIQAVDSLRTAALQYSQAVTDQTGWGNVFSDLERDAEAEEAADGAAPVAAELEGGWVVTYLAEYELLIRDFEAARHLLQQRSRARGTRYCEDYDESYTGIIAGLAEVDGWNPRSYDQQIIQVLTAKWDSDLKISRKAIPPDRKAARSARRRRKLWPGPGSMVIAAL